MIPGIIEKFGETKIEIRQLSQRALKLISDSIKYPIMITLLLPFLESVNWHIREETLTFIIKLFLNHHNKNDDLNQSFKEIDYPSLINAISKLLDDDKPKVVQIVYETIATIAQLGDNTRVLELLLEIVDQETYRKLCDRIEAGALPILRPDGNLDFPYLAFGLSTQNSFYSGTFRSSSNSMMFQSNTSDLASYKEGFNSMNLPKFGNINVLPSKKVVCK